MQRVEGCSIGPDSDDQLSVEAPLLIRYGTGIPSSRDGATVTMRTPGQDRELALGFLFSEGVIREPADVLVVHDPEPDLVRVHLSRPSRRGPELMQRDAALTSSCGACGKRSIEALRIATAHGPRPGWPRLAPELLHGLPDRLRAAQHGFARTGGLHASGLFNTAGDLLALQEDVGRHNALDKLIGQAFLAGRIPLSNALLLLSGRISFELVQKAAMAGLPLVAAVGAPSTLAVQLAREHGITLIGFLRQDRFNLYVDPGGRLGGQAPGSLAGASGVCPGLPGSITQAGAAPR
jgi:FdhD protein